MSSQKNEHGQALRLDGSRVLLVEDEYYIADDVQRILTAAGATIVGPCSTVSLAREAVDRGEFDCAVLDLNLHGESAQPIAERLLAEGRSFAIATGYGSPAVPPHLKDVPRIEKPFDASALLGLVGQLNCARVN
jgi:DNA-binding NtrC family response regulator